nr:hypothetical protein [Paracoccus sp. PS1]
MKVTPPTRRQGTHPLGQAELGAHGIHKARIGRQRLEVQHAAAPLPGQGAGQRLFLHPAVCQQDLAQPRLLAAAHDHGLEQVARIDRAVFDQDLAKQAQVAWRDHRRCGRGGDGRGRPGRKGLDESGAGHSAIPGPGHSDPISAMQRVKNGLTAPAFCRDQARRARMASVKRSNR